MKKIFLVLIMILSLYMVSCENNQITVNSTTEEIVTLKNEEEMSLAMNQIKLYIGDYTLTATLVENSSTQRLLELLKDGPITIDMNDYARMEKVGSLPESLPRNDEQINAESGDLILYLGNAFVIYYDHNSWNFTRLGSIDGVSQSELKTILGNGSVSVTLSIE